MYNNPDIKNKARGSKQDIKQMSSLPVEPSPSLEFNKNYNINKMNV